MNIEPKTFTLKDGRALTLRGAAVEDAEELIAFLKTIAGETPFLNKYPEEVTLTPEQEQGFINKLIEDPRSLMVIAEVDGKIAGNCQFSPAGSRLRVRHRCTFAIALLSEYWGLGIGTLMFRTLAEEAKGCGYEQAELEVVSTNERALGLYRKMGFEATGTIPHAMKYKDGTYADLTYMVKPL